MKKNGCHYFHICGGILVRNVIENPDSIKSMIIDLDGVVWRGDALLPGAVQFFDEINLRSFPYMIATNNSTTTPQQIYKRAQSFNVNIDQNQILTSSQAAAHLLHEQLPNGATVFVIGEEGIQHALLEQSFRIIHSAAGAQAVVVGLDRSVTWDILAEAAYAIEAGAFFLGTNSDTSLPTERGFAPGAGALLHALQATTGVQPITVGKPEPFLFLQSLERLGTKPEATLVIGDRLSTDIQGGIGSGMLTALVLTGVTSGHDLQNSTIKPDFVFEDLNDLIRGLWK